jgi:hypothetical protein
MGQTSTKTQNAVLPQELNQADLQHHYRQTTNLKQDHLLRTLLLSLFWIHNQNRGWKRLKCWQKGTCKPGKNVSAESYWVGTKVQ